MKPYHNKGWHWLSKFELILPITGARERNAFTATSATAPPLHDGGEEGDEPEGSTSVGIVGRHGSEIIDTSFSTSIVPAATPVATGGDQMDMDVAALGLSSIGKHKYSKDIDVTATSKSVPLAGGSGGDTSRLW